ncbi:hypothetical protein [Streptomyces sp. NPDC053720]
MPTDLQVLLDPPAAEAVTARPADTTPPCRPARKLRRKTRSTKWRTARGK